MKTKKTKKKRAVWIAVRISTGQPECIAFDTMKDCQTCIDSCQMAAKFKPVKFVEE